MLFAYTDCGSRLYASQTVALSLDSAVSIAMSNSYRIKQIELSVEQARLWLSFNRASLKSRVYMNLTTPQINKISEYEWNSTIRKDEIIRRDNQRWQAELSISQPVILFGYPTNGYLSLNDRIYRYTQKQESSKSIDYYNRLFLRFEQPIFQPNRLKNALENSELDELNQELNNIRDKVNFTNGISINFFDLYELDYKNTVFSLHTRYMELIHGIAQSVAAKDTTRAIEAVRAQIELSNAQEQKMKNLNELRTQMQQMKQRLRIDLSDSLIIDHTVEVKPINVNDDRALQYSLIRPMQQQNETQKRKREIDLDNTKGGDSFRLNLVMTLGLEKNRDRYQELWGEYNNSYSVSLNAYIPIWDWGRQKKNEASSTVGVRQAELTIEENIESIKNTLNNTLTNLTDYQDRALRLQESLETARQICITCLTMYDESKLPLNDVIQTIERYKETELNFLEAYLNYRRALLDLKVNTYYDFENEVSLVDKYKPGI